jgi:hypothetical protein
VQGPGTKVGVQGVWAKSLCLQTEAQSGRGGVVIRVGGKREKEAQKRGGEGEGRRGRGRRE